MIFALQQFIKFKSLKDVQCEFIIFHRTTNTLMSRNMRFPTMVCATSKGSGQPAQTIKAKNLVKMIAKLERTQSKHTKTKTKQNL